MKKIRALIDEGKRVEARAALTELYLEGEKPVREAARKLLDDINRELVFNPACTEGARIHVVKRNEFLATIGKKYGVNWRMIARINGIKPPYPIRVGQQLKIIPGKTSILVRKGDFALALFIDRAFIKEYPIATGENDKTPAGTFVIEECLERPVWYPPEGGIIKYGEKENPLGERWLGFANKPGANGLGIHGTNEPESIGTKCTNGCLRMLNRDVIELYDFVGKGTTVKIVE